MQNNSKKKDVTGYSRKQAVLSKRKRHNQRQG